jgi:hypothetical protein
VHPPTHHLSSPSSIHGYLSDQKQRNNAWNLLMPFILLLILGAMSLCHFTCDASFQFDYEEPIKVFHLNVWDFYKKTQSASAHLN